MEHIVLKVSIGLYLLRKNRVGKCIVRCSIRVDNNNNHWRLFLQWTTNWQCIFRSMTSSIGECPYIFPQLYGCEAHFQLLCRILGSNVSRLIGRKRKPPFLSNLKLKFCQWQDCVEQCKISTYICHKSTTSANMDEHHCDLFSNDTSFISRRSKSEIPWKRDDSTYAISIQFCLSVSWNVYQLNWLNDLRRLHTNTFSEY